MKIISSVVHAASRAVISERHMTGADARKMIALLPGGERQMVQGLVMSSIWKRVSITRDSAPDCIFNVCVLRRGEIGIEPVDQVAKWVFKRVGESRVLVPRGELSFGVARAAYGTESVTHFEVANDDVGLRELYEVERR